MPRPKPVKITRGWVDVDKIIVPPGRLFSRPSKEILEALEKALLEEGEYFSQTSPIIVNYAKDTGDYTLVDGFDRLELHRKHGFKKIYCIIRVFENCIDARNDAEWGSARLNLQRGTVDGADFLDFVIRHTAGLPLRDAVRALVENLSMSRSYAYRVIRVARDKELSRKVLDGRLKLWTAIEIIEGRKELWPQQIEEKSGKGVISGKEAVSEVEKLGKTRRGRILAKKPRGGRPRKEQIPGLTAGLRAKLERAFKALGIEDESERTLLMSQAAEVLGDYPVKIQMEAVKRWRESSGSISFQEALERVKKEIEEEKAEEASEAVKAEEVEREEREAIEKLRKEAYSRFRAAGFKAKEAKTLAETNVVERAYEELGEHAGALLSKVASRAWARRRLSMLLDGKGAEESFKEVLEHMDEVYDEARNYFNRHLKTPSAEAGDVLLDLQGLVGGVTNVWMLEDGSYLILSKNPRVIVGQRRPFYQLGSSLETQVALANLGKSRIARKVDWIRAEVEIAKLEGEAPINLKIGRLGANAIICPNCGEPLRCMVCGSLVACSECGWPTTSKHKGDHKALKEEARKG